MAQERWWNWLDDDSTFRMNWRDLVLIPYGVYAGFDKAPASNMNLVLEHSKDGKTKVDKLLKTSPELGIWKTKQGVVITEDSPITLNIATGHLTAPRIDLIVGEHQYVEAEGGQTALYKVIQGKPSATPVKPALTEPNKQVEIGWLYIPPACTSLDTATWHKAEKPNAFSDETIMHTDREQTSTALKVFNIQRGEMVVNSVSGTTLNLDIPSNFYYLNVPNDRPEKYYIIQRVSKPFSGAGQLVWCYTTGALAIQNGADFIVNTDRAYIEAGSVFGILSAVIGGAMKYVLVNADEVCRTRKLNKFQSLVAFNKQEVDIVGGKLDLRNVNANYLVVKQENVTLNIISDMAIMKENPNLETPKEGGTVIYVSFKGDKNVISHGSPQYEHGFLNIENPTSKNVEVKGPAIAMFMQLGNAWTLLTIFSQTFTNLNIRRFDVEDLENVTASPDKNASLSKSGNGLNDWNKNRNFLVTDGNPHNDPAQGRNHDWEVMPLGETIENQRLNMKRFFTKMTTVFEEGEMDKLPIEVIRDYDQEEYKTPLDNFYKEQYSNPAVLNLKPEMGNTIIFNFSRLNYESYNKRIAYIMIQGIRGLDYPIGATIDVTQVAASFRFVYMETDYLPTGCLPIKFARTDNEQRSVSFTEGSNLKLVRMKNYWLLTAYGEPVYATSNGYRDYFRKLWGEKKNIIQVSNGQLVGMDGQYVSLKDLIKVVSGRIGMNSYTDEAGNDSLAWNENRNYADVYPPQGYTMADYVGGIASMSVVAFRGDVNADDTLFCKLIVKSDRVRIICGDTEQRRAAEANYCLLFIK
nr:MAG TPA: Structural protein [Herelleviridae sp.]